MTTRAGPMVRLGALALAIVAPFSTAASDADADAGLTDCHVAGIRNGVLCGRLTRPLDPEHAERGTIEVRFMVVPAMARRKLADPVFMLAGGPGQSAIGVAEQVMPSLARLNNRRDIVFVDQRGTGGSAPLLCKEPEDETLAEQSEPERRLRVVLQCKADLLKLPYLHSEGDLGLFTTSIAVQDLDAVRRRLGAERIDLVGGSYGSRVALEYQRQFPKTVRRSVIDGVAPPDMALPVSFSTDNQASFDSLLAACAAEPACAKAHSGLRTRFDSLLHSLPRAITAQNPLTGRSEAFVLTRDLVLNAVRGALYSPSLASALPEAIEAAVRGDFSGLLGLNAALQSRKSTRPAIGMHLSVVCAEDLPRIGFSADKPGAEFGDSLAATYAQFCAQWPRGTVPPGFYTIPPSEVPVLVLSGGIDPVTPPRHGARVAQALGPMARHVVVANAGHGVMAIGCMRDVVWRFIDASEDRDALAVDASCASQVPRPPAFQSVRSASPVGSGAAR